MTRLRQLHRANAMVLGVFLVAHLINHVAIFGGIATHLDVQRALRLAYRLPGIEHVLIALFGLQVLLGLALIARRGRPRGLWAWLQVSSGGFLVLFIAQHIVAILLARAGGLDTNTYFAAAVVSEAPFVWYFAPYYALGITALAVHVAAAIRFHAWPGATPTLARILPILGLATGLLVVAGLQGAFGDFVLPEAYARYLDALGWR